MLAFARLWLEARIGAVGDENSAVSCRRRSAHKGRNFAACLLSCITSWAVFIAPALCEAQPTTPSQPPERAQPPIDEGGAASTPNAGATPAMPEVTDSMLAPVPAPRHILSDWREALRLVRSRSTSLRQAAITVSSAAAQAELAATRYYPTLRATGTVSHPLLSPGSNAQALGFFQNFQTTWRGNVNLKQPILNLQAWHDANTAELNIEAAKLSAQDAERRVIAGVADTIVAVVTAERLALVSRVALRSSLYTFELTQRRSKLGAASSVDVLRAEQEVTLNRQKIINADENVERAREALGMALGFTEPWGVAPTLRLNELSLDAARVCRPVTLSTERSDVQALQKQQQVAERAIQSVDYQLAPTLDFTSDYNYTQPNFPQDAKPVQWSIGALLTVPLYDGGVRQAQRWQQQTQVQNAQNQIEQRSREVTIEMRQAERAVEVARRNHTVSLDLQRVAKETARLSQLSFVNGRGTSFELVEAARRSQEADLDLAVKEFELVRAQLLAHLVLANCSL